jgi:hypothetical protein
MRLEFEKILKNYGHDVFLQRRTQTTGETLSYSNNLEIHTTRYTLTNNRALTGSQQEMKEGIVNTSERVYYFKSDVNPYEGDRIYEQDQRVTQSVWVIDQAYPFRGENGQLIYWSVGATRIEPN